ncbi:MAG: RNA polymerase sigma factor [Planctomycetota bacterium]|nr:MAG: RNA polymerase sigma factor [Planctomycetota bacterium]
MAENDDLAEIIIGCKRGDASSFSQLVDMYARRCYGYFYRLTGSRDVSDDLLSELFVKLVERINTYKGGAFEGWLFRVASNVFHDYLRGKQRRERMLKAEKRQIESQAVGARQFDKEEIDRLQERLGKLDEDTREVIILRFYSQVSFKEIAAMRSEPIGTTLSKLHRGLKKLRELMEQKL